MKALLFHEHGSLENVAIDTVADPQPGPGEVLVQIKAAALNRLDLWVLEGWPGLELKLPHIMGSDGAGVVAAIGDGVADWNLGERVVINPTITRGDDEYIRRGLDNMSPSMAILGEHVDGTAAEYVAVPAVNLLRVPDGFPLADAAAASLVFVTAWHSLITRGGLRAGEDVLVVGAGGGVNTAGPKFEIDNRLIFGKHLSIIGSTMGPRADFDTVMELIFQGRLSAVVDSERPLEEGPHAVADLAAGDVIGKVVLLP